MRLKRLKRSAQRSPLEVSTCTCPAVLGSVCMPCSSKPQHLSSPHPPCSAAWRSIVQLHPPSWSLDTAELEAAFTPRTRLLVLNTPHNPTGKVRRRTAMPLAGRCRAWPGPVARQAGLALAGLLCH